VETSFQASEDGGGRGRVLGHAELILHNIEALRELAADEAVSKSEARKRILADCDRLMNLAMLVKDYAHDQNGGEVQDRYKKLLVGVRDFASDVICDKVDSINSYIEGLNVQVDAYPIGLAEKMQRLMVGMDHIVHLLGGVPNLPDRAFERLLTGWRRVAWLMMIDRDCGATGAFSDFSSLDSWQHRKGGAVAPAPEETAFAQKDRAIVAALGRVEDITSKRRQ
jgi:hypothetical protein